jgi:translation initiation factor IF-3
MPCSINLNFIKLEHTYTHRPYFGNNSNYGRTSQQRNTSGYRINREIRVPHVRLVGDNIENSGAVYSTSDALQMAAQQDMDLVEISPTAEPPVCKIVDFQKFLYQQKRHQKEVKASQTKTNIKEIRFGYATGDHDYQFKLKHAENFLREGNKVRACILFHGREVSFAAQGEALLARFANDLSESSKVESLPRLEGKRMILILAPITRK